MSDIFFNNVQKLIKQSLRGINNLILFNELCNGYIRFLLRNILFLSNKKIPYGLLKLTKKCFFWS